MLFVTGVVHDELDVYFSLTSTNAKRPGAGPLTAADAKSRRAFSFTAPERSVTSANLVYTKI